MPPVSVILIDNNVGCPFVNFRMNPVSTEITFYQDHAHKGKIINTRDLDNLTWQEMEAPIVIDRFFTYSLQQV